MGILEDAKYREMGKKAERDAAQKQSYLAGMSDADMKWVMKQQAALDAQRDWLNAQNGGLANTVNLPPVPANAQQQQAALDSMARLAEQAQGLAGAQ